MSDEYPNKYAFVREDLSVYERVDPDCLPDYDHVDSREIDSARGYREDDEGDEVLDGD